MNKIAYYSIKNKVVLNRYNSIKEIMQSPWFPWGPIELIGVIDRDHDISVLTYE